MSRKGTRVQANSFDEALRQPEQVTSLRVAFEGTKLPPELASLTRLEILSIWSAPKLKSVGPEIGALRALRSLEIFSDKLVELPPQIGALRELRELRINAPLTSLPDTIGELRALEAARFECIALQTVPGSLAQLAALKKLQLAGRIASLDARCVPSSVEELNLGANEMSSLANVGHLRQLRVLDLRGNQLTELPTEIGELSRLCDLRLRENKLAALPASLGRLDDLTVLDVGTNPKLKTIPAGFPALEVLHASHTGLRELPASLLACRNLREIWVRNARLVRLPDALGSLSRLEVLRLDNHWKTPTRNKLTAVPDSLAGLANLVVLDLRFNPIANVPVQAGNLPNLGFLGLPADAAMSAEEAERIAAICPRAYVARGTVDWDELAKVPERARNLFRGGE
jgi:Leucine-rich repeat (LRR) protein